MKKRVFILINTLATGGAERVATSLLHSWKNRYDLTLVLLTNLIEYELPADIRIIHLNQPFHENGIVTLFKLPLLARRYKQICEEGKADVSLSFLKRPNYISCLSKSFGNRTKVIISERSYFSELIKTLPPFQKKLSVFLTKKLYPRAVTIVTNSELMKRDLQENFGIKCRFEVIANPMNGAYMHKMSRVESDFQADGRFTFIHVGAFRKEKNQRRLIDAFNLIRHLDIRLILLGHRYLKEELTAYVAHLGLQSQIIFPDFDTNPFKYLAKSDCFVLPSDFEGFPNSLVEAMTCGLPVISTDCRSGPREILAPKSDPAYLLTDRYEIAEFGILVPVKDPAMLAQAMQRVASDPQLQASLKQKSLLRAADFDSAKITARFSALIDEP